MKKALNPGINFKEKYQDLSGAMERFCLPFCIFIKRLPQLE